MTPNPTGMVQASYGATHDTAMGILHGLGDTELSYGILGCAVAIARMTNPERELEPSEEISFIQQFMEWNEAYWSVDVSKGMN